MDNTATPTPAVDTRTARRINLTVGHTDHTVARQWASRPTDERFLDLDSLYRFAKDNAQRRRECVSSLDEIRFESAGGMHVADADILVNAGETRYTPTNWAFSQLCQSVRAPARYISTLDTSVAVDSLNDSWRKRAEDTSVKIYVSKHSMHACTSRSYGRLHDYKVIDAIRKVAGSGTGETCWKIPGAMDWHTGYYNPHRSITPESTTLFASDRDVFMFLVDDTRPIEIGKLPNGDPDLVFRGFYVWNSEVGKTSVGVSTFLLRAVCENRILWGVENRQEIRIPHTRHAPKRFFEELKPALEHYAQSSDEALKSGIRTAQSRILAATEETRDAVLMGKGFSRARAREILKCVQDEQHREATTVWDFVQGITAYARRVPHQDARLALEQKAATLMRQEGS